jgi:hypothetical protein
MKKVAAILAVVVLVVSLASLAFAADAMKGTVKSVDAKAGSIVLTVDGKDVTLKADKGVDLGKMKAGDKVEASVEKDMVKSIKAAKPKAAVGC